MENDRSTSEDMYISWNSAIVTSCDSTQPEPTNLLIYGKTDIKVNDV